MDMGKEKKGWRISGNNLTVGLLIIALALVSFNYLQTMNLMVQLDEFSNPVLGGTGAVTGESYPVAADGALTVIEFSDFQCPFCSRASPVVKQLREKWGDQINFVYKHFPLRSIHPNAQKAAEAVECARDQGKFEMYHDALFASPNLGDSTLRELAAKISLDPAQFNTCLDSGEKASIVESDLQEGIAKGVTGTPTFFVGSEKIGGAVPFATLDAAVARQIG